MKRAILVILVLAILSTACNTVDQNDIDAIRIDLERPVSDVVEAVEEVSEDFTEFGDAMGIARTIEKTVEYAIKGE